MERAPQDLELGGWWEEAARLGGLDGPDSEFYSSPVRPGAGKRRALAFAPNVLGYVVPKVVTAGTWRGVQEDHPGGRAHSRPAAGQTVEEHYRWADVTG